MQRRSASRNCVKIKLNENISAVIEKRDLVRDEQVLPVDPDLAEKLVSNYIIVKKIIGNLSWQEQLMCKLVCSMWREAVIALQREFLEPCDFAVITDMSTNQLKCKTSIPLASEPLVIFAFANPPAVSMYIECKNCHHPGCGPGCEEIHNAIDVLDNVFNAPKNCMLTVKTDHLSYMPVCRTPTYKYVIKRGPWSKKIPFISGMVLPKLPDINYQVLNIKLEYSFNRDFCEPVNKILETDELIGILIFVTDKYLLHSVEDVALLNYFAGLKLDTPFALGGCIIDDTLCGLDDINSLINIANEGRDYVSENIISIAMFSIPKDLSEEARLKTNFHMYTYVVEAWEWDNEQIKRSIRRFANKVPRFEHSAAMKLSCVGRDRRHDLEQDVFRECFPDTPIVGCYGNGELGVNHPVRSKDEIIFVPPSKRNRSAVEECSIMYSYATVFVYYGWGKIVEKAI